MRVSVTIVYQLPDDLRPGELALLQEKLAQQRGPKDIYLRAGQPRSRLVPAHVYSVSQPVKVVEP